MSITREKIIISLASHDAKMRGNGKNDEINPYKGIEDYHIKVFKYHTTPYAWGGLAAKELIYSGYWMTFYKLDENLLDAVKEIIKHLKTAKSEEYSTERMVQSLMHSCRVFTLNDALVGPFELKMGAASLKQAASIWKLDPSRIELIEEDTSLLDNVSSKVFKAKAAKCFVPRGDFDYSSTEPEPDYEEDEEEKSNGMLLSNKMINQRLKELLSTSSTEDFSLFGITNPAEETRKINKLEQEMKEMLPEIESVVTSVSSMKLNFGTSHTLQHSLQLPRELGLLTSVNNLTKDLLSNQAGLNENDMLGFFETHDEDS